MRDTNGHSLIGSWAVGRSHPTDWVVIQGVRLYQEVSPGLGPARSVWESAAAASQPTTLRTEDEAASSCLTTPNT